MPGNESLEDMATIPGTGNNDTLTGGTRADSITGLAGNDVLYGAGGNDTLYGGDDNDTLHGDARSDRLSGDAGNDALYGGAASESFGVEAGNDVLCGGDGNDPFQGGIGDSVDGGAQVLVAARHLTDLAAVAEVLPRGVTYLHLTLDAHEIIRAEGCWTESFQPANRTPDAMEAAHRAEIGRLFPELCGTLAGFAAVRPTLKAHEVRVLLAD